MRETLNVRRRGFTLIEILSVVVIVGIVSAIILPQLSSRDDLRCASAARALMADLLYAQNRSIALQQMQYVQFNTATNSYQVLDAVSPNDVITHPVNGTPYTVNVSAGSQTNVTLSSVSFDGNNTVAFDSMGVPYSYNGTTTAALVSGQVVIQCNANKLTVSVGPYSGEITVR